MKYFIATLLETLLVCCLITGCTLIPKKNHLDPSALTQDERSYVVKGSKVKLPDGSEVEIEKDTPKQLGNWFIVHEDYVKEHNENQDDLITAYEDEFKLRKWNNILIGLSIALAISCTVCLIILRIRR